MPRKKYAKRIAQTIKAFSEDEIRATEHFPPDTDGDGELFEMIADHVIDADADAPIKRAFTEARLDPNNPFHWLYLLEEFSAIYFRSNSSGPKLKRTDAALEKFAERFKQLKEQNPGRRQSAIYELMKKDPDFPFKLKEQSSFRSLHRQAKLLGSPQKSARSRRS